MSESINSASDEPERSWYELAVDVDSEAVEPVSELFSGHGFNEGVAIDEPYVQDGDGDNLRVDTGRLFTVRTYIADVDYRESSIDTIREALFHLGRIRHVGDLRVSLIQEQDWANAWKEHFQIHKIGNRVVIRPPWLEYEPAADEVLIELDPGMAFGTGLHPSTRLSVLGVEEVVREGDLVLDVGTGSGILAFAALRLGARHVDAVDVESVAIRATRENAERNGLGGRVTIELGSVGPGQPFQGEYDVVFANIIARILVELAEALVRQTRQGGRLVLAGIIGTHEVDVISTFGKLGATVTSRRTAEDWVSLVLTKSS